jgi:hypothetical protein
MPIHKDDNTTDKPTSRRAKRRAQQNGQHPIGNPDRTDDTKENGRRDDLPDEDGLLAEGDFTYGREAESRPNRRSLP